jgi:ribosome-associated protein
VPAAQDKIPTGIVENIEFRLRDEHVRLCDLLKVAGLADSGGQGKQLVAAGEVTVDGQPESRKTAKIRAGQTVECRGVRVRVLGK